MNEGDEGTLCGYMEKESQVKELAQQVQRTLGKSMPGMPMNSKEASVCSGKNKWAMAEHGLREASMSDHLGPFEPSDRCWILL